MARVTLADRCPGVLRPHRAADGAMVRIRVPGGQTTGAALARLGDLATRYGSGLLQLTSRGGVQVRGLPDPVPAALVDALSAAGFLPSPAHDRVRNIVASPLTGLSGGRLDLRPVVADLDRAIIADPALAALPGRFLFVLDDGRGDVSHLALDLGYRAVDAERGLLLVGDHRHGYPVAVADVVPTMIIRAREFLARSAGVWHIRDLSDPVAPPLPARPWRSQTQPLGAVGPHASVAVPLGLLEPDQVATIHQLAPGPLVITPWRGIVIPGAAAQLPALAAAGLITDETSSWTMISACVGAPWCGQGRADTRALAAELATRSVVGGPRTHLSGCERRCGAPAGDHLDLVAPTRDELSAAVRRG